MFRFVALNWNPKNSLQVEAADCILRQLSLRCDPYHVVFKLLGMVVMTAGHRGTFRAHLLSRDRGVILGSIFQRHQDLNNDAPCLSASFDERQTDLIEASQGRSLIADFWGNYVAILPHPARCSISILKDPVGSLPCFTTRWRHVAVAFSCLQDCVDLRAFSFSVNPSYVVARLASNGVDASHNPLNEVVQVHRGECLEIASATGVKENRRLFWVPTVFSAPGQSIDDVEEAARALRACVRSTSHTLASGHSDILMRLSGGLDSSIVACLLKDAPSRPRITSYTYYNPHGRSDERRWARLAAERTGFEHIESVYDPTQTALDRAREMAACVEPPSSLASIARGNMERRLSEHRPYSAVFSGDGGDSGFGAEGVRLVVDDYLRLNGLTLFAFELAARVAMRTDGLAYKVMSGALVRRMRGSRMADSRDRFLNKHSLVSKDIREMGLRTDYFPHPWFRSLENVPWNVIRRLGGLILTPEFYDPMTKSSDIVALDVAPLYSQPFVELALRIPLHVHFHEGLDRGLARKAFAADVPAPILRRCWKDRAPGSFEALVNKNRALLREVILDGYAAQDGLINRDAIEGVFRGDFSKSTYHVGELLALFDLELWISHFTPPAARRAVA